MLPAGVETIIPSETSLLIIADPRGGNLLSFNVGDAYFALMPRIFWVELQTRFGNQFYVRDNGEDGAILTLENSSFLTLISLIINPI